MKNNLGIKDNPHIIKVNCTTNSKENEFVKGVINGIQGFFAWTYKDLKNIPP
jgi:hypothetical protein